MSIETSYLIERSPIPSPMDPFNDSRYSSNGMTVTSLAESTEYDFIKWINKHLVKASPPMAISDLTETNVRNGVALGLLLEIVGGIKLNGLLLQPGTRVEKLHNVHELFAVLRRLNVRLGNLQPEDVMSGDRETILQLTYAIFSHFAPRIRGRRSVSPGHRMYDGRMFDNTTPTRSSPRHTPTDRYTPTYRWDQTHGPENHLHSEHYTEISNPVYSHQIIGPNVYTPQSGQQSPRSRSTMTMLFSGQRSPTTMRRPGSRESSEVSSLQSDARPVTKPRATQNHHLDRPSQSNNNNPHPSYNTVSRSPITPNPNLHSQLQSELAQYLESMNELSSLKTQLGTISRLSPYAHKTPIASESPQLPAHLQTSMFPTKAVPNHSAPRQTEYQRNTTSDTQNAQVQIAELTRMLQAKDAILRQKEEENTRLAEAVQRLQEALENSGIHVNSRPTTNNHPRYYTSPSNTRRSPERYSPAQPTYSHSYDPRNFSGAPQHSSSRRVNNSYPRSRYSPNAMFSQTGPSISKPDGVHVKQASLNVSKTRGPFYGEDVYVPVERY